MNGVVSEAVPIVAIGMATRNAEDPLAQQIRQRMPDLAGLPVVDQTLGEPVGGELLLSPQSVEIIKFLVILGVVARMFLCATRSSCWCT